MAANIKLSQRRTVRFSLETDRRLEIRATADNKSVSDVIRESVELEMAGGEASAGDWILTANRGHKPRPASADRLAFQKHYNERHQ